MPGDLLIEDTDPLSADNSVQQIAILKIDSVKKDAQRTDHPLEQSLAMQENLERKNEDKDGDEKIIDGSGASSRLPDIEESEQLDYEEEVEENKPHRSSKFTSERKPINVINTTDDRKEYQGKNLYQRNSGRGGRGFKQVRGARCHINPNFKGSIQGTFGAFPRASTFLPTSYPREQGGSYLPNSMNYAPSGTMPTGILPVRIFSTLPAHPTFNTLNPAFSQQAVLSQKNAYSCRNLFDPCTHATYQTSSFAAKPLQSSCGQVTSISEQSGTSDGASWALMVDAFVRKTASAGDRGRDNASSYSSRSSYSSSYTSRTSRSSRSRSRTRSPRYKPRRSERKVWKNPTEGNRRRQRRFSMSPDRSEEKIKEHSIECAKAIGLDEEYLKKIEEQKRLRDEVQKRKLKSWEERARFSKASTRNQSRNRRESRSTAKKSSRKSETHQHRKPSDEKISVSDGSRLHKANQRNDETGTNKNLKRPRIEINDKHRKTTQLESSETTMENPPTAEIIKTSKVKAYLAVVVNNVKDLQNAYKRLNTIAVALGSTKKIWQTSPNSVCIIFEKHEHAKQFLVQYHGKVVNGVRLDVTLEKVYLNLATMP